MFLHSTLLSLFALFLLDSYTVPSFIDGNKDSITKEKNEEFVPPDRGTPGRLEGAGTRNRDDDNDSSSKTLAVNPDSPTPDSEGNPADLGCGPDRDPFDPTGEGQPRNTVGFGIKDEAPLEHCV